MGTNSEVLDQFRAALIAREIVPPDTIIADGRLHRCNAAGARGRGDAAYLLHLDGVPAGLTCLVAAAVDAGGRGLTVSGVFAGWCVAAGACDR